MFTHWDWLSDMHYFYDGAAWSPMATPTFSITFRRASTLDMAFDPNDQVFPYPATVAYLLAPLTLSDIDNARYVFMGLAALAAWRLIAVAGWLLVARPLLRGAGAARRRLLVHSLRSAALPAALAGAGAAALLCAAGGVSSKSLLGGVLAGLMVVKPTLAITPSRLLTLRRGYGQIAAAALTAARS